MKTLVAKALPLADIFLAPFTLLSALFFKFLRMAGLRNLPVSKSILLGVGVFPVRDHYYEPQFDFRKIKHALAEKRELPAIDWNTAEQLEALEKFSYAAELRAIPTGKSPGLKFYFNNGAFDSGDAEYWYQLLRVKKPARIFEVGSGHSTRMAIHAIRKNQEEDAEYVCKHVCIEPYEMPWLEETAVTVVRKKVEDLELSFFAELEAGDILFIDSSHMIRPQGDVLFEYLQLLPSLRKGVIVHVHDIFSPRNYPAAWLKEDVRFWNEQYLLEAFLSHNSAWKIIGALNYLQHEHYGALKEACPFLTPTREPGSFYIQKLV